MDKSHILKVVRTRGAEPTGRYTEPDDEESLPDDDGRSTAKGY